MGFSLINPAMGRARLDHRFHHVGFIGPHHDDVV
jgi:hypothetical protein